MLPDGKLALTHDVLMRTASVQSVFAFPAHCAGAAFPSAGRAAASIATLACGEIILSLTPEIGLHLQCATRLFRVARKRFLRVETPWSEMQGVARIEGTHNKSSPFSLQVSLAHMPDSLMCQVPRKSRQRRKLRPRSVRKLHSSILFPVPRPRIGIRYTRQRGSCIDPLQNVYQAVDRVVPRW